MIKKISVIGLGYIGLPTAALLSKIQSFKVHGTDSSLSRLNELRRSKINLFEKSLNILIKKALKKKKIILESKITSSDFFIICVPTPFYFRNNKPKASLNFINIAVKDILKVLKKGDTIILESTVPVGTSQQIYGRIIKFGFKRGEVNFAYCPERVLPGDILNEIINNDRIVGGIDQNSKTIVSKFYKKFTKSNIHVCDAATAEMCKLVENSYRDTNIAFSNEISMICDKHNINPAELIKLANNHPRVKILNPGCGVGGHCIAVDPYFLIEKNTKIAKLIKIARDVNNSKAKWVESKIKKEIQTFIIKERKKPIIAYLGLGYKANSGDLRESPALKIAKNLSKKYKILFVDPYVHFVKDLNIESLDYALKKANLFFILVNHNCFKKKTVKKILNKNKVISFCVE